MHTPTTASRYTLTDNSGALGGRVFDFDSEAAAEEFQRRNPPDHLVQSVYCDDNEAVLRNIQFNQFFSPRDFEHAVREKEWQDGYYKRTGRHWRDRANEADQESLVKDDEAARRLLGLQPGFTAAELAVAYREAVKLNHPDKVASLAVEFRF